MTQNKKSPALQKIRDNTIAEIEAATAGMTNAQKFGYLYRRIHLIENQMKALQAEMEETCNVFTAISLNSNT